MGIVIMLCLIDGKNAVGYGRTGTLGTLNSYGRVKTWTSNQFTQYLLAELTASRLDAATALGYAASLGYIGACFGFSSGYSCEFITGSGILDVFRNNRPESCMRNRTDLLRIYAENPTDVGCLKFSLPGNMIASMLVWTGKRGIYADRLYYGSGRNERLSASGEIKSLIVAGLLGMFNGRGLPVYSIYPSDKLPGLAVYSKRVAFRLKFSDNTDADAGLPYCDTLAYAKRLDADAAILSTVAYGNGSWVNCRDTSGTTLDGDTPDADNADGPRCPDCDTELDGDNSYSGPNGTEYCCDCYHQNFSHCEYYEEDYPSDDTQYVTVYWNRRYHRNAIQEVTLSDDALRNEFTECASGSETEYVYDSDRIETLDREYYSPADIESGLIVELADGNYSLASDAYYCETDGEYYASLEDSPDADDTDADDTDADDTDADDTDADDTDADDTDADDTDADDTRLAASPDYSSLINSFRPLN